jgi:hypothetical protein
MTKTMKTRGPEKQGTDTFRSLSALELETIKSAT